MQTSHHTLQSASTLQRADPGSHPIRSPLDLELELEMQLLDLELELLDVELELGLGLELELLLELEACSPTARPQGIEVLLQLAPLTRGVAWRGVAWRRAGTPRPPAPALAPVHTE